MKLRMTLAAALICAMPAAGSALTTTEACQSFSEGASALMKARQLGLPYEQAIALIGQARTPEAAAALHNMIEAGYAVPVYADVPAKIAAVELFTEAQRKECIKFVINAGGEGA